MGRLKFKISIEVSNSTIYQFILSTLHMIKEEKKKRKSRKYLPIFVIL